MHVCVYVYVCTYACMFSMDSLMPLVCAFLFLIIISLKHSNAAAAAADVPFEQNFDILYGGDRTQLLNQNKTIRISIDDHSGSGFRSKQKYGSGLFHMSIKLPPKDSTGVITTFYIISDSSNTRDEIDFEFLGNNNTQSYILHTNVIVKGNTDRAQEIILWFDPTVTFHDYKLLWNQHQIVFFVDDTPVRVFKNISGLEYPTKPMHIECTIWNATWASQGKLVDWSQGPFEAFYEGFGIDGCATQSSDPDQECYSTSNPQYYWNQQNYWALNASQQSAYEAVRCNNPLVYDYCNIINQPQPPECKFNQ